VLNPRLDAPSSHPAASRYNPTRDRSGPHRILPHPKRNRSGRARSGVTGVLRRGVASERGPPEIPRGELTEVYGVTGDRRRKMDTGAVLKEVAAAAACE
jgi:hypothetical protein